MTEKTKKIGAGLCLAFSLILGISGFQNMNATSQFGRNALWLNKGNFSPTTDDPMQQVLQNNGLRYEENMRRQGISKLFVSAILFSGAVGLYVQSSKSSNPADREQEGK